MRDLMLSTDRFRRLLKIQVFRVLVHTVAH